MQKRSRELSRMARKIIRSNEYTTLATTNRAKVPWVCILAYSFDKNWNLYFVSIPASRHGRNLAKKSAVTCSIFDSHQNWGHGVGLQIEANCKVITKNEFKHVSKVYFKRKYPYGIVEPETKKYFLKSLKDGDSLYKFYKITPKTVWINNPYSKNDERVKVDLNS